MTVYYYLGAHEPLAHRLRTGHAATDERDRYAEEVSDAALDRVVALGAAGVQVACYKGFGLEYEKSTIARAADFADRARRRGLRVGVYMQGPPVYYETFLAETPQAVEWLVRNQFGDFVCWGFQVFRRYMCLNSTGFLDYQKRVIETIIKATHPNEIFVDNTHWNPPPNDCHCQRCQEGFRKHLEEVFGDRLEEETGLTNLQHVEIPRTDVFFYPPDSFRQIRDPIHQEYVKFRVKSLGRHISALRDHAKSLDPNVRVGCHGGCDVFRVNSPYVGGSWFETITQAADFWGLEEFVFRPRVEADGSAVTKGRVAKLKEFYGRETWGGFWGEKTDEEKKISIAESLAFARGRIGSIGNLASPLSAFEGIMPALKWAKSIGDKIAAGKIVAPVATLRLFHSQAFVRFTPMHYACMAEHALFEGHVPFVIATDSVFDRLDDFSVIIVPNCPAMSDDVINRLRAWLRKGGGLILIGDSATTDERLRVRPRHPFADAFDKGALDQICEMGPPHYVPRVDLSRLTSTLLGRIGKGKVAWMPRLTPTRAVEYKRDPYFPFRIVLPEEVRSPREADEIVRLVEAVNAVPFVAKVHAPAHVMAEYRMDGPTLFVHLANLALDKPPKGVDITLSQPPAGKITVYEMEKKPRTLPRVRTSRNRTVVIVPLTRYTLVEIPLGKA